MTEFGEGKIAYEGQTYTKSTNTVSGTPTSGNPISYANGKALYSFDWVNGRRLQTAHVDGADRHQVTYRYDADGIRLLKNVDGTLHDYITQNGKVVRETIGSGTSAKVLDFIYDESGKPFALKYTNGTATPDTYYYVLNLQGDVVGLVNSSGGWVAQYTYNAWGEILTSTGTMAEINPLRYRGYYYDTETGFYYLQSRYYDPVTHRFINADSYATTDSTDAISCNMFAYCLNNPISFSDSGGQIPCLSSQVCTQLCVWGGGTYSNSGVVVISISDENWPETSQTMGESFADAIGANHIRVVTVTSDNFAETWHQITESHVIIHTHGSPSVLAGENFQFTLGDVTKLSPNSNIRGILITACSTGGVSDTGYNIAQAFSKKIHQNGLVLCSSTIVSGYDEYFTATANGAWLFYRNGRTLDKRIPATISIYDVARKFFTK